MARKFLKLLEIGGNREDSLVSWIVQATLCRLTVIARNPIYQAFLRPSSMLCTASRRFSSCHFSGFPKPVRRRHWQLSSQPPSGTLTMSRWFTCLSYQKRRFQRRRRYFFPSRRYDAYYRTAFLPFMPPVRMLSMIMRKLSCTRRIITPSDSHIRG